MKPLSGEPPVHYQWREALFPKSSPAVFVALYLPDEAGLSGALYNSVIRFFRVLSAVLNLVLAIPTFLVVFAWAVVTMPLQPLRLVVGPGADANSYPVEVRMCAA